MNYAKICEVSLMKLYQSKSSMIIKQKLKSGIFFDKFENQLFKGKILILYGA